MWRKIKTFLLKNQTTRQTVTKNTFWLTVSNLGGRLIRAIIIIYAARALGAAGWGVFSYAIAIATFLTTFTDIGLSQFLMRETARTQDTEYRTRILSTTFFIKLVLLVLGTCVIIFAAPHFTTIKEAKVILPIIAFVLVFDTLREFGFAFIRAIEKMEWEAALFLLTNVAIVAFGFAFLFISPTVSAFTYAYAIGTGVGAIATLIVLRRHLKNLFSRFSRHLVKPIFTSAWPLSIATILGLLMLNTDILIIGWLQSAESVGFYSAANRIVQLLYLAPSVLSLSAFSVFSRLAQHDSQKMRRALELMISVAFLASLPIAAGGIIFAPAIIKLIFGASFLPATASFQILLLTLVVDYPVVILSGAAFVYNRQKNLMAYAAIGGVSNVILDFILIPRFGIAGSAWATLAAQILSNVYLWNALKGVSNFSVFCHLKKVIGATVIMAVAAEAFSLLHVNVVIGVLLSAGVYFAILALLKEPFIEEIKLAIRPAPQQATE